MFTGIINDIGTVVDLNEDILTVSFNNNIYTNLDPGTSIAIDGCCLTLKEYRDGNLVFQVSNETFTRTALNNNHCGFVNLELPATLDSFLSGHIVQGHVDSTINIHEINELENNMWNFKFKDASSKYIVDKGSITINGISLTIVNPVKDMFEVAVIDETYNRTNLKLLNIGSAVNVEYDIIIKYLEKINHDNWYKKYY